MERNGTLHGRNPWPLLARLIAGLTISSASLTASAESSAPTRSEAVFEVRFLTEMIEHHAMAVMTGMLCVDRAVHPELEALCEEIIATQSAEIEQMQTSLQDWYGMTHEPEMTPGGEQHVEQLVSLTGEEFEIEFMQMMIRHHSIAVVRASNCVRQAAHEELIGMCEEMGAAQLAEIRMMLDWLCDWYGFCSRGHSREQGSN